MKNLMYALTPLLVDFLSTFVFLGFVLAGVDVRIAIGAAMVVGVGQIVVMKLLKKPVAALQWAGLGLVVILGSASILTRDPRFIMVKPTIVYLAIGAVMMKRGWMLRYLPPVARVHGERPMIAFGYVWAGLMFVTAVANLVVALWFTSHWTLFTAAFPVPSKIALFAIQYLTVRSVARRRIIADRALQPQAA